MCLQSHVIAARVWNNRCMTFLRTAALVMIAILVPGGLVVLVPTFYRLLRDLRERRRARLRLATADKA